MGGTKTSNFHDFWMFQPLGTLIYGLEYTKLFLKIRTSMAAFREKTLFSERTKLWMSKMFDLLDNVGPQFFEHIFLMGPKQSVSPNASIKTGNYDCEF